MSWLKRLILPIFGEEGKGEGEGRVREKKVGLGRRGTFIDRGEAKELLTGEVTAAAEEIAKQGIPIGIFYLRPDGIFYNQKDVGKTDPKERLKKLLYPADLSPKPINIGSQRHIVDMHIDDENVSKQQARVINYSKPADLLSNITEENRKFGFVRPIGANNECLDRVFQGIDSLIISGFKELRDENSEVVETKTGKIISFDGLFNGNYPRMASASIDEKFYAMIEKKFQPYGPDFVKRAGEALETARKRYILRGNHLIEIIDHEKPQKKGLYFDECSSGGGRLSVSTWKKFGIDCIIFDTQEENEARPIAQGNAHLHRLVHLFSFEDIGMYGDKFECLYEFGRTINVINAGWVKKTSASRETFDMVSALGISGMQKKPEGHTRVPMPSYHFYMNFVFKELKEKSTLK